MTNKRTALSLMILLCGIWLASFAASAQQERLQLDHLNRLAGRATEVVEVNLDQTALRALTKLASLSERDRTKLSETASRLKGVYVRGYEFEREGEYSPDDIETVRTQLRAPGWARIVQVGGRKGSTDEVYLKQGNGEVDAYTVISTAPKNICVINVVGPLKLDEISLLDREFGISHCGNRGERRRSK
ncbi:MAG: DUF4252 domain-containing protein [Acidobacteriota bacterium]